MGSPSERPRPGLMLVGNHGSAWTECALLALHLKQLPFVYRDAPARLKARATSNASPADCLPLLLCDAASVARGSVSLLQFLDEAFPGHPPRLLSPDLVERARQRLWADYLCRAAAERISDETRFAEALDTFAQACIGPFFSGPAVSLPDMLAAPFVARAAAAAGPASPACERYTRAILALPRPVRRPDPAPQSTKQSADVIAASSRSPAPETKRLPPEILSQIFTALGDYELAQTLGVPHLIPESPPWKDSATPLDRAILTSSLAYVRLAYAHDHHRLFTQWGARVMIRFGYVHLLEYLLSVEPAQLHRLCDYLLPELASAWGRVDVLSWAASGDFGLPRHLNETPMDEASRNGHVATLEWWRTSGLELRYGETSLNSATNKCQLGVLEWWRASGLQLKIGNVLDFASIAGSTVCLEWWARSGLGGKYSKAALYHASCHGNINVLDWWLNSGLQLVFDKDVLVGATKHGRLDCLEWWRRSGLAVYFTFFDIEEAIEDCVDGSKSVKEWWAQRGLDGEGGASGWTATRLLGRS